ncbi:MAG: hypothetical protein ACTSO3_00995 [Candidatus Heimdallarchaeaceae archaeon]
MIHEDEKYNEPSAVLDLLIPEDEPVFLIRGTDPSAQYILNEWIDTNWSMLSEEKRVSVSAHARKMANYYYNKNREKKQPKLKKKKFAYKYAKFEIDPEGCGKEIYNCIDINNNRIIGQVSYKSETGWTFDFEPIFSDTDTQFYPQCVNNIEDFLKQLSKRGSI